MLKRLFLGLLVVGTAQAVIEYDPLKERLEVFNLVRPDFKQGIKESYIMGFCARLCEEYQGGRSFDEAVKIAREATLKAWEHNPEIYEWICE
jgi:hypothetical protein